CWVRPAGGEYGPVTEAAGAVGAVGTVGAATHPVTGGGATGWAPDCAPAMSPSNCSGRMVTPSGPTWCPPEATAVSGGSRLEGTMPSFSARRLPTSGSLLDPPTR